MALIKALDALIDMPVVFWIDYPGKASVTARQWKTRNQYWVTVQPQTEQSEFERILLHNLLRGVMQTKRFPQINGKPDYIQSIKSVAENDKMLGLCRKINAWVTTAFCHAYFLPYGIRTSSVTWERKIHYLRHRAKDISPRDLRNPDSICFMLDLSSVACVSSENRKIALRIADSVGATRYSRILKAKLMQYISIEQRILKEYSVEKAARLMRTVFADVLNASSLEEKFRIEYQYVMQDSDISIEGVERIYSFVPESIENKTFYLQSVKQINSALVLIQEYLMNVKNEQAVDFHVNLADGEKIQAFANGNKESGYYITVTRQMLIEMEIYAQTSKIPPNVFAVGLDDEPAFRKRLFKCLLMDVFFHEYGHIYNGDCDYPAHMSRLETEAKADKFSLEVFQRSCVLQYRFENNSPEAEVNLLKKKVSLDIIAFSKAQELLKELRERINRIDEDVSIN